ncbi:MAG: STAS-like domain-containing protein [Methylophilaceae bacterium]
MKTIQLSINYSDLASRQAAAELRANVEQSVLAGNQVAISFKGVFSVSESYADELFGVLVIRYGLDWLSDHVAIQNAEPVVFRAIVSAIRQRLLISHPNAPDIALLAARKTLKERQSKLSNV